MNALLLQQTDELLVTVEKSKGFLQEKNTSCHLSYLHPSDLLVKNPDMKPMSLWIQHVNSILTFWLDWSWIQNLDILILKFRIKIWTSSSQISHSPR